MSTYEPGTPAVISDGRDTWRAVKDDKGWSSFDPHIGWVADSDVTDIRPLVVLDLSAAESTPESILRYAANMLAKAEGCDGSEVNSLRDWADQIEAQTKPPKPAEPTGLGAVVEDANGVRWVRVGELGYAGADDWKYAGTLRTSDNDWTTYPDINAVRVLSEGVTA